MERYEKTAMKKDNVIILTAFGILILIISFIIGKINIMHKQGYTLYPLEDGNVYEDNNYMIGGKVSICAPLSKKTAEYLHKQLKNAFPEVTVLIDCVDSATIRKNLMSISEGQNIGYDIIMADGTYLAAYLKEQEVLQPYKTPEAEMLVEYYDIDGYWYPLGMNQLVLSYNPDFYPKNKIANSFRGLIDDPLMYRKFAIPDPENDISGLITVIALGTHYGTEYFDGMIKQEVSLETQEEGIEKLINGEYKIMVLDERTALKRKAVSNDIEILYPSDLKVSIPLINMIIKEEYSANKNVEVCEMITDWFLSRSGQKCFLGEYLRSTRTDMNSTSRTKRSVNEEEGKWQHNYENMHEIYMEFCRRLQENE